MEAGQKQFFDFILERVQDDRRADAESLLGESFAKQATGTFDASFLRQFNEQLVPMLKPEAVDEVTAILKQFGSAHLSADA